MLQSFTPQYVMDNKGCYSEEQVNNLSFITKPDISILDLVSSEIPTIDKYWFVIKKCNLTNEEKRTIALGVAEIVLPLFERKYPNNTSVRECIEATKLFISGHISVEQLLEKKRDAAAAVYASAYAVSAAVYAAAAAVYAAAAAVYAAAAAAAAAASASAAAVYAAADAAAIKQQLLDYLINFVTAK